MADERSLEEHWEQRVRRGAEAFDFSTLIGGVSTRSRAPEEEHTNGVEQANSEEPPYEPSRIQPAGMPLPSPYAVTTGRSPDRHMPTRTSPIAWVLAGVLATAVATGLSFAILKAISKPSHPVSVAKSTDGVGQAILPTKGNPEKGMPDSALTPGEQNSAEASSAQPSSDVKAQVFKAYGIDLSNRRYVLVQLIPASLGGTNNAANLFPTTPWFADLKSRLDRKLTGMVSSREITEKQAITEIKTNWVTAVHGHYIRNYGEKDRDAARKAEDSLKW